MSQSHLPAAVPATDPPQTDPPVGDLPAPTGEATSGTPPAAPAPSSPAPPAVIPAVEDMDDRLTAAEAAELRTEWSAFRDEVMATVRTTLGLDDVTPPPTDQAPEPAPAGDGGETTPPPTPPVVTPDPEPAPRGILARALFGGRD